MPHEDDPLVPIQRARRRPSHGRPHVSGDPERAKAERLAGVERQAEREAAAEEERERELERRTEIERERQIARLKERYAMGRIELDEFEQGVGIALSMEKPHPMAAMLESGIVTRDEVREFVIQRTAATAQEDRPPADFTVDPMQVAYYKDLIVAHKGTPRRHYTFEEWKAGAR